MQAKATDVHCKNCQSSTNHSKDIILYLCDSEIKLPETDILVGDRLTIFFIGKYPEFVSNGHLKVRLKRWYSQTFDWIL